MGPERDAARLEGLSGKEIRTFKVIETGTPEIVWNTLDRGRMENKENRRILWLSRLSSHILEALRNTGNEMV